MSVFPAAGRASLPLLHRHSATGTSSGTLDGTQGTVVTQGSVTPALLEQQELSVQYCGDAIPCERNWDAIPCERNRDALGLQSGP